MTVGEWISLLEEYDRDAEVVLDDFVDGGLVPASLRPFRERDGVVSHVQIVWPSYLDIEASVGL